MFAALRHYNENIQCSNPFIECLGSFNITSSSPCRCCASFTEAGDGALQLGVIVQPVGLQPDAQGLQGDQEIHRFSLEAVFAALQVGVFRATLLTFVNSLFS